MAQNKISRAERREKAKRQKQMQSIGIMILGVLIIVGGAVLISFIKPKIDTAPERTYTTANGASVGNPDAPVKVEIFSSFTCIHCSNFASETEHQVIEQYAETGQIYYTYRAFSSATDDAGVAAQAAFCAGDQGKFWEMHDTIFANFAYTYPRKLLTQMATSVGVEDMDAFEACIDDGKYVDQINADISLGKAVGITGTPSFTINGVMAMEGNQPFATFQQQIEAALANTNN